MECSSTAASVPVTEPLSSPAQLAVATSQTPSFAYFLCLLYSFCVVGYTQGLLGPTILELAVQTSSTIATLSFVFAARSIGFLVGSSTAGSLIDRYPNRGNLVMSVGTGLIMCVTIWFPFISNIYLLVFVAVLHGSMMGAVDNICQILLLRHYGDKVPPYMQALHCGLGIGSLLGPLVLSPFLAQTAVDTTVDGTNVSHDSSFHYAWIIMALVGMPCTIWAMYYTKIKDFPSFSMAASSSSSAALASSAESSSPSTPEDASDDGWHQAGERTFTTEQLEAAAERRFSVKVVLTVGIFLSLYVGCEVGYGSYIYAYAATELGTSAHVAAYLTSSYWASFALGRAIGIPMSMRFAPHQMVFMDLLGCIIAVVFILALRSSLLALFLGTIVYGISVGSVYASAINYTEYLVGVNGRLLSYLTFFAALGEAAIPFAIGRLFDVSTVGAIGMMWVVVVVAVSASTVFFFLYCYVVRERKRDKKHSEALRNTQEGMQKEQAKEPTSVEDAEGEATDREESPGKNYVNDKDGGYARLTEDIA